MLYLSPQHFVDYELIDSGEFEKLERFGKYLTIRPEPQAIWDRTLSYKEWEKRATVKFNFKSNNSGDWEKYGSMPDEWNISYHPLSLTFKLRLTGFKHVGVFPEQAVNWDYIAHNCKTIGVAEPKFLNLFAYTGISSVAARASGAKVTHVDSVKQVVTWANENLALSNKTDIRWIVEDARKFVQKEISRGNTYNGIILDPPAFGVGAKGENWKLERDINQLLKEVAQILDKKNYFLILNSYSLSFSSLILENLIADIFKDFKARKEYGELYLQDSFKKKLPLGVFARFSSAIE
jgi:23S rRNA (cytosine1962-C5)-methyltransferase